MITSPHRVAFRLLLGALTTTALTVPGFAAPTSPTMSGPVALAATNTALQGPRQIQPSFCPFGKARKHGKGCRGGSVANAGKKLVKGKNGRCLKGAAIGAAGGALAGAAGSAPAGGSAVGAGALVGAMTGCAGTL